jgi:SAM-dependent methyltransferase
MADVVDRLETVKRDFPRALFYGAGALRNMLTPAAGVGEIVAADLAPARLSPPPRTGVIFDEEFSPFAPASFDLVVSLLTLHAANDPVGALAQMRASLKPDGLLIAVLFGEETLIELRRALYESEAGISGGVSPRVAPFAAVRDLGGALQRAGFAMPVVDVDNVKARYAEPMDLFADLRGMGETSCLAARGKALWRAAFAKAAAALAERSEITFDIVTLTGWAPHPSQPKPLKPGSATRSLERAIRNF